MSPNFQIYRCNDILHNLGLHTITVTEHTLIGLKYDKFWAQIQEFLPLLEDIND